MGEQFNNSFAKWFHTKAPCTNPSVETTFYMLYNIMEQIVLNSFRLNDHIMYYDFIH